MAQTPGIFTCGGTDMLKKMNILQRCHQVTRLLRYQAGLSPAADSATAETALEVRRRASVVLQNPMYHENPVSG